MPKTIKTIPSLWDFATAFYAKAGVQSACLTLQDQAGVNVPLLLCCCWVGRYYGELPREAAKEMGQFTDACSQQTTEPLRAIRASMKYSHKPQWPIKEGDWSKLREQIKALELSSEKLLLQGLEQLVLSSTEGVKGSDKQQHDQVIINCTSNINIFFDLVDKNQEVATALLNIIKAASDRGS